MNFIDDIKEFNFTTSGLNSKVIFYAFGRRSLLYMQNVLKFNDIKEKKKNPHMEPSRYTVGELLLKFALKMQKYFSFTLKDKKINCPPIESLTIRLSLSSTSANNNEQFIAMRA